MQQGPADVGSDAGPSRPGLFSRRCAQERQAATLYTGTTERWRSKRAPGRALAASSTSSPQSTDAASSRSTPATSSRSTLESSSSRTAASALAGPRGRSRQQSALAASNASTLLAGMLSQRAEPGLVLASTLDACRQRDPAGVDLACCSAPSVSSFRPDQQLCPVSPTARTRQRHPVGVVAQFSLSVSTCGPRRRPVVGPDGADPSALLHLPCLQGSPVRGVRLALADSTGQFGFGSSHMPTGFCIICLAAGAFVSHVGAPSQQAAAVCIGCPAPCPPTQPSYPAHLPAPAR